MKVLYYCALAQQNGYARAAEDYCLALHRAGVDIAVRPLYDCDLDNLDDGYEDLRDLATRKLEDPTHVIIHAMPPAAIRFARDTNISDAAARRIAVTTWETDRCPLDITDKLDEYFDAVITPSWMSAMALERAGAAVLPHCFNPDIWRPLVRSPRNSKDDYVFYTIGANSPRKNLEGLLKVYLTRFRADDPCALAVVCRDRAGVENLIQSIKDAAYDDGKRDFPLVGVVSDRLSTATLVELHEHSDCYVSLSRGEAWNLGAFEAAIMGNHVIATQGCGHRDFLSKEYDLIPSFETPAIAMSTATVKTLQVGGTVLPLQAVTRSRPDGVDGDQFWCEPDLKAAGDAMRLAMIERPRAQLERRKLLRDTFGYEAIGGEFKKLLESL